MHRETCPACKGLGVLEDYLNMGGTEVCIQCHGTGYIEVGNTWELIKVNGDLWVFKRFNDTRLYVERVQYVR